MTQFSNLADKELNRLSRRITKSENVIEEATKEKDKQWDEVFNLFDEFGREGKEARFIADDGTYLARQARNRAPKINEAMLERLIFESFPKAKAQRLWNSITKRSVDTAALEQAVLHGKLDSELVMQCTTEGGVSFARVHNEWTKEDTQRAVILGINYLPERE